MSSTEQKPVSQREEGRRLAVEVILWSRFGRRESEVGERVIHSLRKAAHRRPRSVVFRRPGPVLAAAAASVMAIVGAGLWFTARTQGKPVVARIVQAKNGWQMAADGKRHPLTVGDELRAGDRVGTAADGVLDLAWIGRPTTMVLEGLSFLSVSVRDPSLSAGGRHLLLLGRLTATVARRNPATPFVVETPHARLTVVGTVFSATVGDKVTRMEVKKGAVRMTRMSDETSVVVPAGHGAAAGPGLELKVVPVVSVMESDVIWRDSMDGLESWLVTEWREKGGITMDVSSALHRSPPGALRLRYTMPGSPPTRRLDEWVVNARSVERRVSIPNRATHMRFWLKVVSAKPRSRFAIWLTPEERRSGWSRTVELEGMTGEWRLIEEDLRHMPEFWSKAHGTLRGNEVPPMQPGEISIVELSLNLADAEVVVDDLEFVRKGPR